MRSDYTVEVQDYRNALTLHYRSSLLARIAIFLVLWLIPCFGLLLLLLLIYYTATGRPPADSSGYTTSLMMIGSAFFFRFMGHRGAKKQFQQMFPFNDSSHRCYLDVMPDVLLSGIPGSNEGRYMWSTFYRYLRNDKVLMLYTAKQRFLFVPVAALQADVIESIEQYLPVTVKRH